MHDTSKLRHTEVIEKNVLPTSAGILNISQFWSTIIKILGFVVSKIKLRSFQIGKTFTDKEFCEVRKAVDWFLFLMLLIGISIFKSNIGIPLISSIHVFDILV